MQQIVISQPEDIDRKSKDNAMGTYLMMFASIFVAPIPFINFIASWVYYAIFYKKDHFVAFHAYQSMLSQLLISVINVAVLISFIVPVLRSIVAGFEYSVQLADLNRLSLAFLALWNLFYLVYSLLAAIASYKGRFWYMPFFGTLAFERFYGSKAMESKDRYVNKPPRGY